MLRFRRELSLTVKPEHAAKSLGDAPQERPGGIQPSTSFRRFESYRPSFRGAAASAFTRVFSLVERVAQIVERHAIEDKAKGVAFVAQSRGRRRKFPVSCGGCLFG
jgi:hypothetical protein